MNEKQQKAIDELKKIGEVVAQNKIKSAVYVDLKVQHQNGFSFDVWKVNRFGKAVLVG